MPLTFPRTQVIFDVLRRTWRQRAGSPDEGSALVEMALMMPIMCLFLTGIFAFSVAYYQKLELANAVAAGGRFLSVDRGDTDPCATTATKIYATSPTLSSSKMTLTFVLNGTSYSNATCSGTTNMISGGSGQVKAVYPCTLAVYGMSFNSCSLTEVTNVVVQ
jgi:Flp pilus assembly protein TadG